MQTRTEGAAAELKREAERGRARQCDRGAEQSKIKEMKQHKAWERAKTKKSVS